MSNLIPSHEILVKENPIKITQTSIIQEFNAHIDYKENKRILFSAPFGAGKSTFLNDFFNEREDIYIVIKLYPVHYTVANNDDVFELIKFDILCELLHKYRNEIDLQKEEFSTLLTSQVFGQHRIDFIPLVESIIEASGKVGKPAKDILIALKDFFKDFKAFKKEIETDEEKLIEIYLEKFNNKPGVNEMDDITNLISSLLDRTKTDSEIKETVLIIDDLDRLDPEHVFRLFNIFSAHYDSVTEQNKFGFDKIIFVCDINNIRKMFAHRYGAGVDFSGYIDKFYSLSPFHFDNSRYLKETLFKILKSKIINIPADLIKKYNFLDPDSNIYRVAEWILYMLIESKELNLRSLINLKSIEIPRFKFKTTTTNREQSATKFEFIFLIKFLHSLFPDYDSVEIKLKKLTQAYSDSYNPIGTDIYLNSIDSIDRPLISYCLPFLISPIEIFNGQNRSTTNSYLIKCPVSEKILHYNYYEERDFSEYPYLFRITEKIEIESEKVKINAFELFLYTFLKCKRDGIIK
ncbi:hypothetical protein C3K47_11905 [Solitalea longa]|uniref:KAP NTPase domain-containing protein n=1 Tax=Solitalea longa TaxID=2079460 RepID=A0A2S5A1G4_9SPHI|nr:P-loop NTPase fold protein [Solitalea longa]POY36440.1 hypothetical protein C3K47_11905 [Solitalea longa]